MSLAHSTRPFSCAATGTVPVRAVVSAVPWLACCLPEQRGGADDLETTLERCHPKIAAGAAMVFTTDDLLVVAIEVTADTDAMALAPVVTGALLDQHSLVAQIIVFLAPGDLPVDRDGEPQRTRLREAFVAGEMSPRLIVFNRHT